MGGSPSCLAWCPPILSTESLGMSMYYFLSSTLVPCPPAALSLPFCTKFYHPEKYTATMYYCALSSCQALWWPPATLLLPFYTKIVHLELNTSCQALRCPPATLSVPPHPMHFLPNMHCPPTLCPCLQSDLSMHQTCEHI